MQFPGAEPTLQSPGPAFSVEEIRQACWITLAVAVYLTVFRIWFDLDARAHLLELFRSRRKRTARAFRDKTTPWADLEMEAQWVVDGILAKLPAPIRAEAEKVAVLFDERRKTEEGRVLLGLYCGFIEGRVSERKGPIVLFLRNIEEACARGSGEFQAEVRITYLHELGHHFGWSEQEVEGRGL